MKRWIAILLATLLLPIGMLIPAHGGVAEDVPDVWTLIERYEDSELSLNKRRTAEATAADYAAMTDGVADVVKDWAGYVEGSMERHGDFLFWDGTDGLGYGYSPRLREKLRSGNATGVAPESVGGVETVSYAKRGGSPASTSVAVFGPYYGIDTSFTSQYRNEGNSIAQATSGTCTVYSTTAATIDHIADALETSAVVIFDSHGDTDYASGNDYTSRANTSYICLQSGDGITNDDMKTVTGEFGSYKHAYYAGSGYGGMRYYCVDGTAIANHMDGEAPNSLLWMAICLGMATDGMEAPLHEKGVEVVYGYSQSVTFSGDYNWEEYFWGQMKKESTVADAVAYMKDKGGYKDPYERAYPAYPIVASSEDVYPGHGKVDAKQDVYSTWTLISRFTLTALSSDESLGTVSVSGTTITATPKAGCAIVGYDVLAGDATLTQEGDGISTTTFRVSATQDSTVRINFAKRSAAKLSFVTPEGVTQTAITGYVGDTVTLPTPSGKPSADAHEYLFYGWTDGSVSDTDARPDCLYAGKTLVLTDDRTFYALYSYAAESAEPLPEGSFMRMVGEPADWSGDAVLTYDGKTLLSAGASAATVGNASAAIDLASTGIEAAGDSFYGVSDAYLYTVEPVGDGSYTIRMKGSDKQLALCYSSSGDKLSATAKIVGANAYWRFAWEGGSPVITNVDTPSAALGFDTASGCFVCKKNAAYSPLTLYSASASRLMYTTELKDAQDPTPGPQEIDAEIAWNAEDVAFKGATPYVIANGSAQTPRFTVKNKADGSTVDPKNYDAEYLENTNAGTGYVILTFKGDYTGTAQAWFKIYLPATTETAVENVSDGIRIAWKPVEGAAGYVIYRRAWSSTTDGWTTFERWNNTTELAWTDTKVYAGTRYQYGVKAYFDRRTDPVSGATIGGNVGDNFNLGEVGPLKTTVRITTRTLSSVTPGTKQLSVKWSASSVFTGYQIQYATDAAFTKNANAIKISDPKTAQTDIKNLKAKTTYYVRVRSYHEFNGMTYFGEWSNVLSAKTK